MIDRNNHLSTNERTAILRAYTMPHPPIILPEVDFLAQLNPQPTLHLTRYFPRYHYQKPATSKDLLRQMAEIAQAKLARVELGNMW